jgi:hypothetical protein
MALTYRLYRTPRIGDGATPATAFRSKLADLVTGPGETFWDWINDARPVRYALALCEPATHAAIDADGSCAALTGQFADTITASMGISNVSYQLFSPTDDTVAHALVSPDGCEKVELLFDATTGDPSGMNCLVAKV